MKLKAPTEHEIQRAIVKWAALNSGRHPALKMIFAIPNGGKRHIVTARKMKAEGVKPGVPDLMLPVPMPPDSSARPSLLWFHGLFLEVKRGRAGVVSEQQALWCGALKRAGYAVEVVRSVDEGVAAITGYLDIR